MGTLDSAVGSGSLAESTSLNIEVRSSDASNATVCTLDCFLKNLPLFALVNGLSCITCCHYCMRQLYCVFKFRHEEIQTKQFVLPLLLSS